MSVGCGESSVTSSVVNVYGNTLEGVDKFCYLWDMIDLSVGWWCVIGGGGVAERHLGLE